MQNKRAKMTPADLSAAARLRALWDARDPEKGLTQDKAAEALDITQGAISQYLNGKIPLGLDAVLQFAKLLDCEPEEIRDDIAALDALPRNNQSDQDDDLVTVRLWDARASAGPGADNGSAELTGGLIFRGRSLRKKGLSPSECDTFYVTGDSMLPRLRSGDAILFDRTDTKVRDGKIYVIQWGDETRVKRLYKELDGSIRVTSDNKLDPENQDRIVRPNEEGFEILGRFR